MEVDNIKGNVNHQDEPLMVTIRCITYNHEPYIRQCLDGFVMQKTNFRFEAIVHDDASTDGTAAIIREYAEKYPDIIKPIYEKENQYSKHDGSLRRIMDAHMRGKYVAICEGDDYWIDSYKLQKQVDFLEANPEYALVYTDAYIVDSDSKVMNLRRTPKSYSGDVTKKIFQKGSFVITATSCYRRDYYSEYEKEWVKVPFPMKMGDLPLWIYLSLKGKFKHLEEKTTCYRILSQSASHFKEKEKRIEFIINCRDVLFYFNAYFKIGISEHVIYRLIHKRLIRNMASYDKKTFWNYYKAAVKQCPSLLFDAKMTAVFILRMVLNKKC